MVTTVVMSLCVHVQLLTSVSVPTAVLTVHVDVTIPVIHTAFQKMYAFNILILIGATTMLRATSTVTGMHALV